MARNDDETTDSLTPSDRGDFNGITETISVPDRDMSPDEMALIMRKVARVCNMLAGGIMRSSAMSRRTRVAGAGHPICQNILNCGAQADAAAMQLEGPSQIAPANVPVGPQRMGRA